MRPGLYIHIPFCQAKCRYCDFCSYAGLESLIPRYVKALIAEAKERSSVWGSVPFGTIYVGGGTPTLLSDHQLGAILHACRQHLHLASVRETSVEANPATVSLDQLVGLRRLGVDRVSIGVQSLRDEALLLLGRGHSAEQAFQAIELARAAGFDRISLDLLYGLPRQTLADWQETLEMALGQHAEHLSLYALSLEPGTPLADAVAQHRLPLPDDDLAAEMYTWASQRLRQAGYGQYEISNWAHGEIAPSGEPLLIGSICRHNVGYWRNGHYLGLGAGAVSYDGRTRCQNTRDVHAYLTSIEQHSSAICERETLDRPGTIGETMMLSLRLTHGISWRSFERRFGVPMRSIYDDVIRKLCADQLLEADARGIRLTMRGRLLGNRVFAAFLP